MPPPRPVVARNGDLVTVHTGDLFTLEPGHRMRAARCVICHQAIGPALAAIIGVAALAGDACNCGSVYSEAFILHAAHLPLTPAQMETVIRHGTGHHHPWL